MKLRGSFAIIIAMVLIMLVVVVASLRMDSTESKLLPLIFASAGIILCTIALWQEIRIGRKRGKVTVENTEEAAKGRWSGFLLNIVWIGGFVLGIYFLGFVVAIPLFMLAYTKWLGTRWLTSILSSIAMLVLVYLVFEKAVNFPLYRGLLFGS